jgi:Ca-activated chloride channel family protein
LALAVTSVFAAMAEGAERETQDKTLSPYFFIKSDDKAIDRLPLKASFADVTIAGVIANVELEQIYKNEGEHPIEAVYVFPASTRAAVHAMKLTVGKRTIEAKIKKKKEAQKTYEKAKNAGKTTSLLEQKRPNVFQMSVANIMPGDRIKVALSYTELIVPDEREYEFQLPTVVGPRYSTEKAGAASRGEEWIANPYLHEGEPPPFEFGVDLKLSSAIPIAKVTSPSHDVAVEFTGEKEACISLSDPEAANRDFIVRYGLAGDRIESGLITYKGKKESFFLMMMAPPKRGQRAQVVPREYIFIVDVSGSMSGFPLSVSKTLIKNVLEGLNRTDYFNLLLFAGGNELMAKGSLRATEANVQRAWRWLDARHAGGGTSLLPALQRALDLPRPGGTSRIVTVMTDGYVTVEKEAYTLVRESLGKANLFTFGIGSSVNRHLIEILARAGTGEPFVVLNRAEAHRAASRFREYIKSPLLKDITVSFDGFDAYELSPRHVADLFAQRPVVLSGKYRGEPRGRVMVKGTSGRGAFSEQIAVASAAPAPSNQSLKHLWARSRIRTLADLEILARSPAERKEITRLGLKYSLMTSYTSFVAVDKVVRANGRTTTRVRMPSAMPQGVSDTAIGGLDGLLGGSLSVRGYSSGSAYGFGGGIRKRSATLGSAPRIRSGATVVKGGLAREQVRRVVNRYKRELRLCYERLLAKSPGLKGDVVMKIVIAADGTVKGASVVRTTLNNKAAEKCMLKAIKRWRFPSRPGGDTTVITYPFSFAPR